MPNFAFLSPVPLRYDPQYEKPEDDEARTAAALLEAWKERLESTHAKNHGLLRGELQVMTNLPPTLAQGMFATPMAFPLIMLLSTEPADILGSHGSAPRGMAIKVIGVEGGRLPGTQGDLTQDFVLSSKPVFPASGARQLLQRHTAQSATSTDKTPRLQKALSAVARGAEKLIEGIGGHPDTHILGETFHTQFPILYGAYMAKLTVVPISPGLTLLRDVALDLHDKPDGMRDAVTDFFATHSGEWELRVQLCTDLKAMPIEDASVRWPEDLSPAIPVARITVAPQHPGAASDGLFFHPWHGLAAHRPLGSIMRARQAFLRDSASAAEPRSLDDLPA